MVGVTFLNIEQVRHRTSLSKQEIYRRVWIGAFPKQVPIGPARVAWVETEVDEWAQKILERSRTAIAAPTPQKHRARAIPKAEASLKKVGL